MKNILYFVIFTTFISCNFNKNEKNTSENIQIVNNALNLATQQAAATLPKPTDTAAKKTSPLIPTKKEKPQNTLKLAATVQSFSLNTARDTTIFGENRTRIFIPAHSFVDKKGNEITEAVAISLKECYKPIDIIKEKLSTVCDNRLLETEGMIYIEANTPKEKLKLKKGASIIVHFPKKEPNDKADIFYGQKDAAGIVSWKKGAELLGLRYELKASCFGDIDFLATGSPVDDKLLPAYVEKGEIFDPSELKYLYDNKSLFTVEFGRWANPKLDVKWARNQQPLNLYTPITQFDESEKFPKMRELKQKLFVSCQNYLLEQKQNLDKYYKKGDSTWFNFYIYETLISRYKSNTAYKSSFKTKYNNTTIKDIEEAELNFYIFNANELGWINCDRFIESQEKRVDFVVETAEDFQGQVNVIFTDMKCAMAGIKKGNRYEFNNVPKNRVVKIVAMQQANKQVSCAIEKAIISEKPVRNLTFKNMTMNDLDVALEDVAKN